MQSRVVPAPLMSTPSEQHLLVANSEQDSKQDPANLEVVIERQPDASQVSEDGTDAVQVSAAEPTSSVGNRMTNEINMQQAMSLFNAIATFFIDCKSYKELKMKQEGKVMRWLQIAMVPRMKTH
jgi:hypothetical protein